MNLHDQDVGDAGNQDDKRVFAAKVTWNPSLFWETYAPMGITKANCLGLYGLEIVLKREWADAQGSALEMHLERITLKIRDAFGVPKYTVRIEKPSDKGLPL